MSARFAIILLLVACALLAALRLGGLLPTRAAALGFAVALVVLGLASRGFRGPRRG